MVNTNIQFPVQIDGSFVAKPSRQYRSGEYRQLNNAEVLDGLITRRRNMRAVPNHPFGEDSKGLSVIGQMDEYVIATNGYDSQWAISSEGCIEMFNPAAQVGIDTSVITVDDSNTRLIAFFEYNKQNYWIYSTDGSDADIIDYHYVKYNRSILNLPSDYNTSPPVVIDSSNKLIGFDVSDIVNFKSNTYFIFKERLWLCQTDGLYFSKATDPSIFTAPDGGFFKFPDDTVKWAVALKDTIFVICETSIYSLTYTADPNSDAVIRKISDNIGGEHAIIFRDVPIFINREGFFSIVNGNSVSKLGSSDLDVGQNVFDTQRLSVFNEYLVVTKGYRFPRNTTVVSGAQLNLLPDGNFAAETQFGNSLWLMGSSADQWVSNGGPYNDCPHMELHGSAGGFTELLLGPTTWRTQAPTWNPTIEVKPNTDYVITCWYKAETSFSYIKPFLRASLWNKTDEASGPFNTVSNGTAWEDILTNADGWESRSMVFNPGDHDSMDVLFGAASSTGGLFHAADVVRYAMCIIEKKTDAGINPKPFSQRAAEDITLEYNGLYDPKAWGPSTFTKEILLPAGATKEINYLNADYFTPGLNGNTFGNNVYFVNMDTGSIHTVTVPLLEPTSSLDDNYFVIDVNTVDFNMSKVYFTLFCKNTQKTMFVYMDYEKQYPNYDSFLNITDTEAIEVRYRPNIVVEFDSLVVDGNEYLIKKYRNLEVQGVFPNDNFEFLMALDNSEYLDPISITDAITDAQPRPHYPHRIGSVGRGHSINLLFRTKPENYELPVDGEWSEFEISDIRILWYYSNRAIGRKQMI